MFTSWTFVYHLHDVLAIFSTSQASARVCTVTVCGKWRPSPHRHLTFPHTSMVVKMLTAGWWVHWYPNLNWWGLVWLWFSEDFIPFNIYQENCLLLNEIEGSTAIHQGISKKVLEGKLEDVDWIRLWCVKSPYPNRTPLGTDIFTYLSYLIHVTIIFTMRVI